MSGDVAIYLGLPLLAFLSLFIAHYLIDFVFYIIGKFDKKETISNE